MNYLIIILIVSNFLTLALFFVYYRKDRKEFKESKNIKGRMDLVNEKLKGIDENKREFIDVITHELNTPLATTSGYLSMILEFSEKDVKPVILELARKSFEATRKMSNVVQELIATTDTIGESRVQTIQIEEIIDKILNDFSDIAKEHFIDLSFKPPKQIPLPLVVVDPLSIKIILTNLIDNAMKYTKKGEIWVEAEPKNGEMLIKVSDTGVGISKENQKRIFEKFFQGDSSRTREVGGTGVGLSIVKNLTEEQGGKVWVESQEGRGSTFYFTVPLA